MSPFRLVVPKTTTASYQIQDPNRLGAIGVLFYGLATTPYVVCKGYPLFEVALALGLSLD